MTPRSTPPLKCYILLHSLLSKTEKMNKNATSISNSTRGYVPKKAKTLTIEQWEEFVTTASDEEFTVDKLNIIFNLF